MRNPISTIVSVDLMCHCFNLYSLVEYRLRNKYELRLFYFDLVWKQYLEVSCLLVYFVIAKNNTEAKPGVG